MLDMRRCLILVMLLIAAAPAAAQQPPRPELQAVRAASPPSIDGDLNDEAWQVAPLSTGEWGSYNPLHGDTVPQATSVWMAYDDDYLYFAFKCDDPEPSGIKTSITRRDNIWNDDWVGLSLDALGTGQIAYHMMVNPSGVQLDALNSVAGNEDSSPDWLWDSAGRLTDTGYAVEMRLPLQSIRFKGGRDTRMGLLFFRRVSRLGMSVSWPAMAPGVWVFERHASLHFDRIESRRVRELLPSATFSSARTRETPTPVERRRQPKRRRLQRQDRPDTDDHARCDGKSRLQSGRERCVSGGSQSAVPDLLRREAAVLHGRHRHLRARRAPGGDNSMRTAVHTRRIVDPNVRREAYRQHRARGLWRAVGAWTTRGSTNVLQYRARAVQLSVPTTTSARSSPTRPSTGDHNRVIGADLKWRLNSDAADRRLRTVSRRKRSAGDQAADTGVGAQVELLVFETEKWMFWVRPSTTTATSQMATAFHQSRRHHRWLGVRRAEASIRTKRKYPWLRRVCSWSRSHKGGEDRVAGGAELLADGGPAVPFHASGLPARAACRRVSSTGRASDSSAAGRTRSGKCSCFAGLASTWHRLGDAPSFTIRSIRSRAVSDEGGLGINFQPTEAVAGESDVDRVTFDRPRPVSACTDRHRQHEDHLSIHSRTSRCAALRSTTARVGACSPIFCRLYEPRPGTVVYVGYGSLLEHRDFVDGQMDP